MGVWRKQHFAGKQGIRAQLVYEGVVVRAEEVDGAVVLSDRTQISTESPKRWNYLPFELYCAERKLEASEILRSDSHSGSPIVDQTKSPFRVAIRLPADLMHSIYALIYQHVSFPYLLLYIVKMNRGIREAQSELGSFKIPGCARNYIILPLRNRRQS